MRAYRVAIRPVVTYGTEIMILQKLRRFERKIVRIIYGPETIVEGAYQRLMNSEIQERLQGEDIMKTIKTQALRWSGHKRRMGEEKVVKK